MRLLTLALIAVTSVFAAGELSGRRAPSFTLPETSARMHDTQDYRGKVLIVDFMQTSCAHCAKFSTILEQAKMKYGAKIAILSVVNPPSDQKSVAEFIAKNKITTPILFDCGQVSFSYLKPTGTQIAIPHVFVIDADGMIRNDFGFSPANTQIFEGQGLFAEIDKALAPRPAGSPKR
jgi:peroxiredoxin